MWEKSADNMLNAVSYPVAAARISRGDVAQQTMFRKDWWDIYFFCSFHFSLTSLGGVKSSRVTFIRHLTSFQSLSNNIDKSIKGYRIPTLRILCLLSRAAI